MWPVTHEREGCQSGARALGVYLRATVGCSFSPESEGRGPKGSVSMTAGSRAGIHGVALKV